MYAGRLLPESEVLSEAIGFCGESGKRVVLLLAEPAGEDSSVLPNSSLDLRDSTQNRLEIEDSEASAGSAMPPVTRTLGPSKAGSSPPRLPGDVLVTVLVRVCLPAHLPKSASTATASNLDAESASDPTIELAKTSMLMDQEVAMKQPLRQRAFVDDEEEVAREEHSDSSACAASGASAAGEGQAAGFGTG